MSAKKCEYSQIGLELRDKTMELVKSLKFESPRGPVEIDPATRDLVQNIYITRTERKDGKLTNTLIATYPRVKDPFEK